MVLRECSVVWRERVGQKLMEEDVEHLAVAKDTLTNELVEEVANFELLCFTRGWVEVGQFLTGVSGANGY